MIASHESDELRTFKEALTSPAKEQWMKAMKDEMESIKTMSGTWLINCLIVPLETNVFFVLNERRMAQSRDIKHN